MGHLVLTYTVARLIASITDVQGDVTSYGYDARGNRKSNRINESLWSGRWESKLHLQKISPELLKA